MYEKFVVSSEGVGYSLHEITQFEMSLMSNFIINSKPAAKTYNPLCNWKSIREKTTTSFSRWSSWWRRQTANATSLLELCLKKKRRKIPKILEQIFDLVKRKEVLISKILPLIRYLDVIFGGLPCQGSGGYNSIATLTIHLQNEISQLWFLWT